MNILKHIFSHKYFIQLLYKYLNIILYSNIMKYIM